MEKSLIEKRIKHFEKLSDSQLNIILTESLKIPFVVKHGIVFIEDGRRRFDPCGVHGDAWKFIADADITQCSGGACRSNEYKFAVTCSGNLLRASLITILIIGEADSSKSQ